MGHAMNGRIDFSQYNKICVIGAPGAGKTFLAHRLAQYLGRPWIQFDELRFGPRCAGGNENSPAVCARRLGAELRRHGQWVAEGTAWQPWTEKALRQADLILVVRHGGLRRVFRILWRWLWDNRYHRGLKSTCGLIRVSLAYDRERLPIILGRIRGAGISVYEIRPSHRDNRRGAWRARPF